MKVSELVARLLEMPPDAEVAFFYDSAPRGAIDNVWLARSGDVILHDSMETIREDRDRPEGAPASSLQREWRPS